MERTLIVSVSEDVYESIKKEAEQKGQPPEELVSEWLAIHTKASVSDPLDKLVGILSLNTPGWSDRHDFYLGQAILESMRGDPSDDKG